MKVGPNITNKFCSPQNPYYQGSKEILGLQILKFICALLVVQIHMKSCIGIYIGPFTRIAVPIFFMITGYFLPDSFGQIRTGRLKRTFNKVLKLELIACAVYLGYFLLLNLIHSGNIHKLFNMKYWFRVFIIGVEPCYHLWYLIALMQSIIIIFVCQILKVGKWIYWMIPIGLIFNLLFGSYNFLVENRYFVYSLVLSRNVITVALPCILIGTQIRHYEHKLPSQKTILIFAVIGLLGIYVETTILKTLFTNKLGDIVFLTIPFSTVVFVFFLRMSVTSRLGNKIANLGKEYSMDIYLWHLIVALIIFNILDKVELRISTAFDAFIVIIATLVTAICLKLLGIKKMYS